MENQRLFLVLALGFVVFLIWQAWVEEEMVKNAPPVAATTPITPSAIDTPAASATRATTPKPGEIPTAQKAAGTTAVQPSVLTSAERVQVTTDEFLAEIDLLGGNLVHVGLRKYPESLQDKNNPFVLMSDSRSEIFIAQSGLLSSTGAAPDHFQKFTAAQSAYTLAPDQDTLEVPLTWSDSSGVKVTKTYIFHRASFVIDLTQRLDNASAHDWRGRQYRQFQRSAPASTSRMTGVYTYTGGVISTPEKKYEKIDFGTMAKQNLKHQAEGGWIAMIQHYFLGAWIPKSNESNEFYSRSLGDNLYVLGLDGKEQTVPAGGTGIFQTQLYVGPKVQDKLNALAPLLGRTVDYGWLWFIAEPIFWLLKAIHNLVGNWGWSIILLTILVKLLFFKLSETSYRSMANMRKLAPQLQKLKERYGDDRQKMNQAMMEIYKKEKINPLGGCLPIVVQIPVFISLYWVLLESVELRQSPWIGWIQDLAIKDPYFILPIIMGATMFFQQKLSPAPPDPMQAKVMMALPLVFTFMFLWFPAGLVLYWVVNNTLSIAQQYVITKRVEAAATAKT
ncbi:MAG: membrane protein insertase YidC [Gammaproteobacteria bacterium]